MAFLGRMLTPTDTSAIHDDEAGEIAAITEKASPVAADLVVIEDSADTNAKKRVQVGNLPGGSGTDPDAIHDNVAAEISAVTEKASPVSADLLLIEDSADSNNKKRVQVGNLPTGADPDAIHDNVAAEISAVAAKAIPVDADLLLIEDSADSDSKKSCQIGNLPFCSSTDSRLTDDRTASGLRSATTVVAVSSATAPTAGQVLTATSSTAATWQDATATDAAAIHDSVAGEIDAVTEKGTPVAADLLLIEDSADSSNKKSCQVGNLPFCASNDSRLSDDRTASGLRSATTVVVVSAATAPSAGQILTASSSTAASWQDATATDAAAIHDNVSGEISAITEKASPVSADLLLIEDSADSNNKKRVQIGNLPAGTDAAAIHDNVSGEVNAITEKTTPVAADLLLIEDSADSYAKKKVTVDALLGGVLGLETDSFTATAGQTAFTLSDAPNDDAAIMVVNGIVMKGADYSVSGTGVTYSGQTLVVGDVVEFWYIVGGALGGGGGLPLIPVLAGIASENLAGWKAVGSFSFNPSDYTYTTATLEVLLSTSNASHQASARLWNVTTDAQVGSTLTSTSLTPEVKQAAVTMTAGANTYELQIKVADAGYVATCGGSVLRLS